MSQTQTQTLHRSVVNPTRNHDYLYDKTYTLSSERDHARDTYKAHTKVERVKRVPEFQQMFSALPHYPRFQVRLEATDPVPQFINRRWRGYAVQNREAMIRYTTFNYDPSVKIPSVKYEDARVSGQNRYKYFRRPIIPFLQQVPPEVLLQPTMVDPLAPPHEMSQRPVTPATRNIEIQTDYRDSEAQTDPFTPEYVVRPGSAPELLTLATLTHGHGLPAGLAEVEMIERARAKRAWERTLPPLSDVTQLDKRKKMMDEMETREWSIREIEIEKLQEARLEVLKTLLIQREAKQQELNDKRLDKLWSKKQKAKEEKIQKIRKEHIKIIRGRAVQNKMYEGKEKRLELIQEIRSTHALQTAQQQMKRQEKQQVITLQRQRRLHQDKESYVDGALSQIEGESIADMLDFLSKELIRLEEERRIHAFSMLAERRRRIREAEESGRRQVEERRRREEDEIFKQLIKVHQSTVDTYLEDIIMSAVDNTADEQARQEIREYADKINDVAYDLEERRTLLQSEEIVSELVHSFLLPEVLKVDSRQKVKLEQRKHLLAAHRILHATTEPIINETST
uniref:Cilia- and flagella-associated protein 91 n=1 Tax=Ciona savignyi TaxID=51511 RepID=H2YHN5_CIOSA